MLSSAPAYWKHASRPSRIGRIVLAHWQSPHDAAAPVSRGRPAFLCACSMHGKSAMKQEGTQANCERQAPPLRVVIEGHCVVIFLLARWFLMTQS